MKLEDCPFKDIILEMNSRLGNIEGKLDIIVENLNNEIERMDNHIREGVDYRKQVETNTAFRKAGVWVSGAIGVLVGAILSVISWFWGKK